MLNALSEDPRQLLIEFVEVVMEVVSQFIVLRQQVVLVVASHAYLHLGYDTRDLDHEQRDRLHAQTQMLRRDVLQLPHRYRPCSKYQLSQS